MSQEPKADSRAILRTAWDRDRQKDTYGGGALAEAVRAFLATPPADRWQAIETAPKEERVLVVIEGGEVTFGYQARSDDAWVWTRAETGEACRPTHWMPLPDPPQESSHG